MLVALADPSPENDCGVRDDESSVFLSSSKETLDEAWESAAGGEAHQFGEAGFVEDLLPTAPPDDPLTSLASMRSSIRYPNTPSLVRGPLLWRLFPRCIRATNEEVCIAAEVTLSSSPCDCSVTAVKDGRPLPVRIDFLNDRQATGEDSDQPSRHGRGPISAPDAARRRAARELLQALRPQRPDSELVLIWLTPGTAPGLVLIELHTRLPGVLSAAHSAAQVGDAEGMPASPSAYSVASTGALVSAWHTPTQLLGLVAFGAAGPYGAGGSGRNAGPNTGPISLLGVSSAGAGGESWLLASDEYGRNGGPGASRTPLTASLNRPRALALSGPTPMQGPRGNGFGAGASPGLASVSSGALSVVIVPDAGMEAEVCALLALQHQQTPLPVTGSGDAAAATAAATGAAGAGLHAMQMAASVGGRSSAGGSTGSQPVAADSVHPTAPGSGVASGNGALSKCDEDSDDARARERFLWDLGAWLELAAERAAAREAEAAGAGVGAGMASEAGLGAARAAAGAARRAERARDYNLIDLRGLGQQHLQGHLPQTGVHRGVPSTSEIEEYSELPDSHRTGAGDRPQRTLASGGPLHQAPPHPSPYSPGAATAAASGPAPPPVPRAVLELLGFACSRGWAATSTHIVLGLLDMGHAMHDVNAAVQAAHGWSALHLAAASGSAELVAMTALWRSYARYGDGAEASEEWRAMLAAPGPGGLTPLHLAAVLPAPATAALDLLSSLPTETLCTWFGVAARDGCTPAHYASRAGNSHLNDHALLCLATGCAGLEDLDPHAAQGLTEVLSVGDLHLDFEGSSAISESMDAEWSQSPSFPASGNVGADEPHSHPLTAPGLPRAWHPIGLAAAQPEDLDFSFGPIASLRSSLEGPDVRPRRADAADALGAAPSQRTLGAFRYPAAPTAAASASSQLHMPFGTRALQGLTPDVELEAEPARAEGVEPWSTEPWQSQRRLWPQPTHLVAGLLDRVSPVASAHGSVRSHSPPWSGAAAHSPGTSPPNPAALPQRQPQEQQAAANLQRSGSSQGNAPLSLEEARRAAYRLVAAAARAAASAPASAAAEAPSTCTALRAASAHAAVGCASDEAPGSVVPAASARSAPLPAGGRLLAEIASSAAGLAHVQRQAQQQRQLVQRLLQHQMQHLQAQPGDGSGGGGRLADSQPEGHHEQRQQRQRGYREGELRQAPAANLPGKERAGTELPQYWPVKADDGLCIDPGACATRGFSAQTAPGSTPGATAPENAAAAAASEGGATRDVAEATHGVPAAAEATMEAVGPPSVSAAEHVAATKRLDCVETRSTGTLGRIDVVVAAGAALAVALAYIMATLPFQGSRMLGAPMAAALGWILFAFAWPCLSDRVASRCGVAPLLLGACAHAAWLCLSAAIGLPSSVVLLALSGPQDPQGTPGGRAAPAAAARDVPGGGAFLAAAAAAMADVLTACVVGLMLRWLVACSTRAALGERPAAPGLSCGPYAGRPVGEENASIIEVGGNAVTVTAAGQQT